MQTSLAQSCADQRWMRHGGTAVWEEASEKEAQKSDCSTSYTGSCMCTCVLASESLAASAERAVARLVELCLYYYTFNGTKQESSCCPPTPSSANNWQCLIHCKGEGKPPPSLLCKGWSRLNPLGLSICRRALSMEMVVFTFLSWKLLKHPTGFGFPSWYLLCTQAVRARLSANQL